MNTKPIPFELWKNANPDLVESAESCDSCHGIGSEMCQFCKGDGYTITEGDESSTATCRYCKGEGFIQCDCCKGEKTTIFQLYQAQHKRDLSLLLQIKKQEIDAP